MTEREALKLALSTLNEVRSETFRLMRNGQTLYAEKKVWDTITAIKEALANVATNDTLQERVDKTGENVQRNKCPPCHGNCRQGRDCPARGLA